MAKPNTGNRRCNELLIFYGNSEFTINITREEKMSPILFALAFAGGWGVSVGAVAIAAVLI